MNKELEKKIEENKERFATKPFISDLRTVYIQIFTLFKFDKN